MINEKLRKGDVVPIYLKAKNDEIFEGMAKLISLVEQGDSFYEDCERLKPPKVYKTSLTSEMTDKQQKNEEIFNILEHYFSSNNPDTIEFWKSLKKLCSRKSGSYNAMFIQVELYKDELFGSAHQLNGMFMQVPTKYIVRYAQQKFIQKWTPTLFRLERWLVEIQPKDRFSTKHRTTRKIKVLLKISPHENQKAGDLIRYTTYDGDNIAGFTEFKTKYTMQNDDEDDLEPTDEEIIRLEKQLGL